MKLSGEFLMERVDLNRSTEALPLNSTLNIRNSTLYDPLTADAFL
jgi:hypothetical protein